MATLEPSGRRPGCAAQVAAGGRAATCQARPPLFEGRYFCAVPRADRLYARLRPRRRRAGLEVERVPEILERYGLRPGQVRAVSADLGRSTSLVVETTAGRKVLKRYQAVTEPATIVHEHSILDHLARIDFPAPRLTRTLDGATFVVRQKEAYALFDYLDGYFQYHHYFFIPSQTRQFVTASGQALAALHRTLRGFVPAGHTPHGFRSEQGDRWKDLGWFTEQLDRFVDRAAHDRAAEWRPGREIVGRASWIKASLVGLERTLQRVAPERLIIHGDYGPYNLLFRPGAPVVILDFELARLDWRLSDLVKALGRFSRTRFGFDLAKMRLFIGAYEAVFPLERQERELLPSVWRYLTLQQVISWCHRYSQLNEPACLEKARRRLELACWLQDNEAAVASLD